MVNTMQYKFATAVSNCYKISSSDTWSVYYFGYRSSVTHWWIPHSNRHLLVAWTLGWYTEHRR